MRAPQQGSVRLLEGEDDHPVGGNSTPVDPAAGRPPLTLPDVFDRSGTVSPPSLFGPGTGQSSDSQWQADPYHLVPPQDLQLGSQGTDLARDISSLYDNPDALRMLLTGRTGSQSVSDLIPSQETLYRGLEVGEAVGAIAGAVGFFIGGPAGAMAFADAGLDLGFSLTMAAHEVGEIWDDAVARGGAAQSLLDSLPSNNAMNTGGPEPNPQPNYSVDMATGANKLK